MSATTVPMIQFYDYHPRPADLLTEVMEGLRREQKQIPPKFFYDEKGSKIFEAICKTPEYYLTRTERGILQQTAESMAHMIGHDCLLFEPGSGNCEKVRLLLEALKPRAYIPMDISRDHLKKAARKLAAAYPWLDVYAVCVDYTRQPDLSFCPAGVRRIAFFPGSSIGNFEPQAAIGFLSHMAEAVGEGGGMLIGVDLKKDSDVLEAAYNDDAGVTAAFNLNLLERINRELDADFDVDRFAHHAFYNQNEGRIEMHLRSRQAQVIHIQDQIITLHQDETVHTENSYKYTIDEFQSLACKAGFVPVDVWTDPDALFSVHYLEVPGG